MPDGFEFGWKFYPPEGVCNTEEHSIMEDLQSDEKWDEFLAHLISNHENVNETIQTASLIRTRGYREICESLAKGEYKFSDPTRIEIPKPGKKETRKIYTLKKGKDIREHTVVRMISWLLNRYSYYFSPNLYSVSDNDGVRGAVNNLLSILESGDKYCYKADLTNFFNTIDIDIMMDDLYSSLDERDKDIVKVLETILRNPVVRAIGPDGNKIGKIDDLDKGVMAGMPFAPFLANFFLKDLDWILYLNGISYYRYADDIMVAIDNSIDLDKAEAFVNAYVRSRHLTLNPKKIERYEPGEDFIFLGICFNNGKTTISDSTLKKQKAKLKTAARKYRRMYERGQVTRDTATAMMVRWVGNYHYGSDYVPYSFSKMYFPLISSSEKLNSIDRYAQECIRYVYTGKMRLGGSKEISYKAMKLMGYLPLVSAFRIYKKLNRSKNYSVAEEAR
ncbi:MAG: hypothetical protein IJ248_03830 [Candidatus Methanomethylophilaceae archaeon]|nr:hypothetical protein [Candidatus Methanomethylophilaceae archaeon]